MSEKLKREKVRGKSQFSGTPFSLFTFYFPLFTFHSSLLTALALGLLLSSGCATQAVPEPRYLPARDLLAIVKDFQRLAREDLYRFPIPKDVTGINILKATLVRLDEYDQALAYYGKAAESNGQLGTEAAKNIEALESFQRILKKPLPTQDPLDYIKGLDEKVEAWNAIIRNYQGTPYEHLARVEEERIDRAKVAFFELNRYRLNDGNQLVILGYSQLVTKHRDSKNLYRYLLDFGDFYTLLAKEYAFQKDPEGLSFDLEAFEQLAKSALKLYTEVAQVDGILEKIEAQGKIEGRRGLMEKMRRLNR